MKKPQTMRERATELAREALYFGRIGGDKQSGLANLFVTFAVSEQRLRDREILAVLRQTLPDAAKVGQIAAILDDVEAVEDDASAVAVPASAVTDEGA